jgi:hypothetical protein
VSFVSVRRTVLRDISVAQTVFVRIVGRYRGSGASRSSEQAPPFPPKNGGDLLAAAGEGRWMLGWTNADNPLLLAVGRRVGDACSERGPRRTRSFLTGEPNAFQATFKN